MAIFERNPVRDVFVQQCCSVLLHKTIMFSRSVKIQSIVAGGECGLHGGKITKCTFFSTRTGTCVAGDRFLLLPLSYSEEEYKDWQLSFI